MTTETTDNTLYYYSITELFKKCSNRTLQRVRGLKDNAGRPIFDTLALTNSDLPTYNSLIRRASAKVFSLLQAIAQGVEDGYQYDVGSPESSTGSTGYIVYTVTLPENWDPNATQPVDILLENALVLFVVREWFRINGAPEFSFEFGEEYNEISAEITGYTSKRTKPVVRPYRIM